MVVFIIAISIRITYRIYLVQQRCIYVNNMDECVCCMRSTTVAIIDTWPDERIKAECIVSNY